MVAPSCGDRLLSSELACQSLSDKSMTMPGVRLILRVNYASLDTREIYFLFYFRC